MGFLEGGAESRHEVGSDDDLTRLVEANLGVGILPRSNPAAPPLVRRPIEDIGIERTISLYGVSGRERTPAATALMKLLRARDWSMAA